MFLDMGVFILILILAFFGVLLLTGLAVTAIIFLSPEIASEYRIRKHKADIEYMERIQELEEEYKAAHGIKDFPYTEESHTCRLSGRVVNDEYIPCEENLPEEETNETPSTTESEDEWDEEFEKQLETEEKEEEEAWDEEEQAEAEEFTQQALKEDPSIATVIEEANKQEIENEPVEKEEVSEFNEVEETVEETTNENVVEAQPKEEDQFSQTHLDSLSGLIAITTTPKFGIFADATGKWYAVDKNNNAYIANTLEELNKFID